MELSFDEGIVWDKERKRYYRLGVSDDSEKVILEILTEGGTVWESCGEIENYCLIEVGRDELLARAKRHEEELLGQTKDEYEARRALNQCS